MGEKPAWTDDQVEAMAWELEIKMMEIRKDPNAALTAGLARIRSIMIAEMQADLAKLRTETEAARAKIDAEYAAQMEADLAKLRAKTEAAKAEIESAVRDRLHRLNAEQR